MVRSPGSADRFGFQLRCRYNLEVLWEPLINMHRHASLLSPQLCCFDAKSLREGVVPSLYSARHRAHPLYWGEALHAVVTVKGRFLIDDCSPELAFFQGESGRSAFYGIYVSVFCFPLFKNTHTHQIKSKINWGLQEALFTVWHSSGILFNWI